MSSVKLYRDLLRAARTFPVRPVGRKIAYNCRELFDWYRNESRPVELTRLQCDGEAALRVIGWMRQLPQVGENALRFTTSAQLAVVRFDVQTETTEWILVSLRGRILTISAATCKSRHLCGLWILHLPTHIAWLQMC